MVPSDPAVTIESIRRFLTLHEHRGHDALVPRPHLIATVSNLQVA